MVRVGIEVDVLTVLAWVAPEAVSAAYVVPGTETPGAGLAETCVEPPVAETVRAPEVVLTIVAAVTMGPSW